MAECEQPPVSTPRTRSRGSAPLSQQEFCILSRVNVIRDDRKLGGPGPPVCLAQASRLGALSHG